MQTPTIYVKKVPIEKDGRKFNAWETYDTKDKMKMSVSFTQDGDKEPENSCHITALDWWIDRRQKYPRMRIREYTVCEQDEDISEEKNQRDYDEFFASEIPTKSSKK